MNEASGNKAGNRILFVGLGLIGLFVVIAFITIQPPRALGKDAPSDLFSAGRATAVLEDLLTDGVPHPIGSPASRETRDRIWRGLEKLGYQPELQREAVCGESGSVCGVVENVLARRPGRHRGKSVLVSCHYDSVAAGPGAGDDGSGVAILLELARVFASETPDNSILFFFGEGEEVGLLGAEAFVQKHPWATEVGAVVNVEARGTSGRSWMFETSARSSWLIDLYASAVSRPATSSIAYAIYRRLPNDTDLTVYKMAGLQGIGLAFIGDVQRYHTPLDDTAHLSADTLQQQGQTALEMTRALAGADLTQAVGQEAVFFDVAGLLTVWWPVVWSIYFSVAAVLLLIVCLARLASGERLAGKQLAWGVLLWPVAIGLTWGVAAVLGGLLDWWGVFPSPFPSRGWPAEAAFGLVGLATPLLLAALASRQAGTWGLWAGSFFWWTALAVATTILEPALGYPFLPPVLATGVATAVLAGRPGALRDGAGLILPSLVSGVMILPTITAFYDAFGRPLLPTIAVLVALTATWLGPLLAGAGRGARWSVPAVGFLGMLISALVALPSPAYTSDLPQHLNLRHVTDGDSGQSWWMALGQAPFPTALSQAAGSEPVLRELYPWTSYRVPSFQAPALDIPPPLLEITGQSRDGTDTILELRLRSQREATYLLAVLPSVVSIEAVGYPTFQELKLERVERGAQWRRIQFFGVPAEGVRVRLRVPLERAEIGYLLDATPGLPAGGGDLQRARGEIVPFGEGDVTLVFRKFSAGSLVASSPRSD